MSESHCHCHSHCRQPQPPVPNHLQLPDPSHLSFDHLRSLISTPVNSTRSLTLIVRSMVHYPERYMTATYLPVFTYLLDLPAITCDYPWTPGSPSDSPANSPAHPSVRTPFPCGQEQFSVRARTTRILIVKILTFSPLSLFPVISPINISLCYLPVASGSLCDRRLEKENCWFWGTAVMANVSKLLFKAWCCTFFSEKTDMTNCVLLD